jgi:cell shape-determining protein MreD
MALQVNTIVPKFFQLIPLILLFLISLNGISIIEISFFTVNIHYILVYYWVLRKTESMGYGFIFISGIISDVVLGLPLGINSLSLLCVAAIAAYIRVFTVRITLINDWLSFIPALLLANLVYFIALFFLDFSTDYLSLFKSSIFTFIFYPVLWLVFSGISNLSKL